MDRSDIKFPIPPVYVVDGQMLTQSLILEHQYDTQYALFTNKYEDFEYKGKVYPSLRRLYLDFADVTEYSFAVACFSSWEQWVRVQRCRLVKDDLKLWREELEMKVRSMAVRNLVAHAKTDKGFAAAKWLAEKGWMDKSVGRPTKEAIAAEAKKQNKLAQAVQEDLVRLQDEFNIRGAH